MSIQEDMAGTLMELLIAAPSVSETQRLTMLAGNGLAMPMAGLRANQAQREYDRLAKRLPRDHSRRVAALAKAKAAKLQCDSIQTEIDRLSVEPKPASSEETAVHGYVRSDGKPIKGAEVILNEMSIDPAGGPPKARAISSVETDECGMFAISAAAPGPLSLSVKKNKELVLEDKKPVYHANGLSSYRLIDLAKVGKPCDPCENDENGKPDDRLIENDTAKPNNPVPPPRQPDPILTADIKGRTLHNALEVLEKRKIDVKLVRLSEGGVSTPEVTALENASGEASVVLHVAAGKSATAQRDVFAALIASDEGVEGTPLDTVSGARDWLRKNKLATKGDIAGWAEKPVKDIQAQAKIKTRAGAAKIRRALIRASALVKEE